MAFRSNTASANNNTSAIPDDKKALGYINIYLPTATGKGKLVGIPMIPSKDGHEELHKWLMSDPEKNVRTLLEKAIVDYTPVTATAPGTMKFIL